MNNRIMYFKILLFIIFLTLQKTIIYSQKFNIPIDKYYGVAGNFGELRESHFHTGIDFRTDGKENLPIYNVHKGYVSRVAILPTSYGKVVYITHPSIGKTTLYAHLNDFNPTISNYLNQYFEKNKTNNCDIKIDENTIPIDEGEIIGYSGNTGNSHAPHLHFEVRNSKTEEAENPELFFDNLNDISNPLLNYFVLFDASGKSIVFDKKIIKSNKNMSTATINYNKLGLGISAQDYYTDTKNFGGIYNIELKIDDILIYNIKFDKLNFSNSKQVKSVSEYESEGLKNIYKLFSNECSLNIFNNQLDGFCQFKNGEHKILSVKIEDFSGNKSISEIKISYNQETEYIEEDPLKDINFISCFEDYLIKSNDFEVDIEKYTIPFSKKVNYEYSKSYNNDNILSLKLLSMKSPCLKPYTLTFKNLDKSNYDFPDKIYLEANKNTTKSTFLGRFENDKYIIENVNTFGEFNLAIDNIEPTISLYDNKLLYDKNDIVFKILDKESGINSYDFYIDNVWKHIYYDKKNNALIYKQNEKFKISNSILKIIVTDKVGNIRAKEFKF